MPDSLTIELNRIQYPVESLGPGRRLGIWMQGCSIHCRNCISRDLWCFDSGKTVLIKQFSELISQLNPSLDGISITGGEPFDQYNSLVVLCSYLKKLGVPHIQVFSGYTMEQIEAKHPDRAYAQCIDILIDGPYEHHRNKGESWRGSNNQNYYAFTNGSAVKAQGPEEINKWALHSTADGAHYFAGIPGPRTLKDLENYLSKNGIHMRFEYGY